mmetsp:Transcript_36867/g.92404  ORF Transcript_36867/g.92404 Transcript_36867/m.92404 type:complete len:273 (-) Transcript_36867:120-938(-)
MYFFVFFVYFFFFWFFFMYFFFFWLFFFMYFLFSSLYSIMYFFIIFMYCCFCFSFSFFIFMFLFKCISFSANSSSAHHKSILLRHIYERLLADQHSKQPHNTSAVAIAHCGAPLAFDRDRPRVPRLCGAQRPPQRALAVLLRLLLPRVRRRSACRSPPRAQHAAVRRVDPQLAGGPLPGRLRGGLCGGSAAVRADRSGGALRLRSAASPAGARHRAEPLRRVHRRRPLQLAPQQTHAARRSAHHTCGHRATVHPSQQLVDHSAADVSPNAHH